MTKTQRKVGLILCLFTIVLAILDQNIVSAAIVPIVRDLDPVHGVEHVAWLVAAFALAATVVLPLYGRLCDTFGAKPVWLGAVGVFLTGSVLCGVAQTMPQLIAFRAVQGVGAGGLMSVTMVVMAHLAEPGERGRNGGMGGLFAGVGMAIGPFIGGLFADHGSWRGIFFINVPLALVVIVGGLLVVRIPRDTRPTGLDLPGALLAAVFAASLLLVCEWGGQRYGWSSPTIVGMIVAGAVSLGLFVWRESTAEHPVLPPALLRHRLIRDSYVVQFLVGGAMLGAMVYLMLYLQVARGIDATGAGLYLAFMAAGLTISGIVGGRTQIATRTAMVFGTACATLAFAVLARISVDTSLWTIRGALVLLGVGFGQLIGRLIGVVQDAAPPHQLGVATTGIRFFQSLGGAIGAATLGSLLSRVYLAKTGAALSTASIAHSADAVRSFVDSVGVVFGVAAVVMLVALLFAARLTDQPRAVASTGGPGSTDSELVLNTPPSGSSPS